MSAQSLIGFLIKPYSDEQLRASIETALARYRAEKSLSEKERYYRSILNGINEDILVIDQYYRVTDANDQFLKTVGKSREEILGRSCYEVAHDYHAPCHTEGILCALPSVFKTGKPATCRHVHTSLTAQSPGLRFLLLPCRIRTETSPR